MKERYAPLRRTKRRSSRGFTLVELMVVVVLVSILAGLAVPSFQRARDDRIAFDYARQYQQIFVQVRARATGTGSAHLVLMNGGTAVGSAPARGVIRAYAALDGNAQPNPVSSCKSDVAQWTATIAEPTDWRMDHVLTGSKARLINYASLNQPGVVDSMGLTASLFAGDGTTNAAMSAVGAIAVCMTPGGTTYVGTGSTLTDAVAAMRAAAPFNGLIEAALQRRSGNVGIGLKRRVVLSGSGTPRLRSE